MPSCWMSTPHAQPPPTTNQPYPTSLPAPWPPGPPHSILHCATCRRWTPCTASGLARYTGLFEQSLHAAAGPGDARPSSQVSSVTATAAGGDAARAVAVRIIQLGDRLVQLLHASVGRALRNRHRLPLLMHLAQALHPAAFPPEEWQLLLGRTAVATAEAEAGSSGSDSSSRTGGQQQQQPPAWVRQEHAASYRRSPPPSLPWSRRPAAGLGDLGPLGAVRRRRTA